MKKTIKRTFPIVLALLFLFGFTLLPALGTIYSDSAITAYANKDIDDNNNSESIDNNVNIAANNESIDAGTTPDTDKIRQEIENKTTSYNSILTQFEAAKINYENAKRLFEESEEAYNTTKTAYEKLADDYVNDVKGVKYEDVKAAYKAFESAYDISLKAQTEAQELLETATDLYNTLTILYNEINNLVKLFNEAADEEYDNAIQEHLDNFKEAMQQYLQDKKEYSEKKTAYNAEFKESMKAYKELLNVYKDEMTAYETALSEWEIVMAEYEKLGQGMVFIPGSQLLKNNAGNSAMIRSCKSANAHENGNQSKINPNDRGIKLTEGLFVIAYQGSKQWIIRVDESALGTEFILWAHGNNLKEYLNVLFNDPGEYLIGGTNGMNHLFVVAYGVNPGDKPAESDAEKPVKPTYDFDRFTGERPELTDNEPIKKTIDGLDYLVWNDELGEIVWAELVMDKNPDSSSDTSNRTDNNSGSSGRGLTSTGSPSVETAVFEDVPTPLANFDQPANDIIIIDEKIPMTDFSPVEIEDETIPLVGMPQTGTDNSLLSWFIGLFLSMAMAYVMISDINRRKKEAFDEAR